MLCRAILTAIAISCTFSREILHAGQGSPRIVQIKDVICVLLLSGLQKEELDANTMEKLRRHNVNIYDMNNESLRQECLLKSLSAGKGSVEIIEDKNGTLSIPIIKETQNIGLNTEIHKSEIATTENYSIDKSNLRSLIDEIKIKGIIQREDKNRDNIKRGSVIENTQDEINVTIFDENKDTQPSMDSVVNFWSKFTRKGNADDIFESTTTHNPQLEEEATRSTVNADNKGYVHSREVEYINRIIAEYLASQTVPTTTQLIKRKKKNTDFISRKIKELLAKKAKDEEIDTITALKSIGDTLNMRPLSDLNNYSGPIRINNRDNSATRKVLRITSPNNNYGNSVPTRRQEGLQYDQKANFKPRSVIKEPAPKLEALQYLDSILRLNEESDANTDSAAYPEATTNDSITKTDEHKQKLNKDVQYITANVNNTNKVLNQTYEKATDHIAVPADMIQKIADKVKEIVLKDIRKDVTEAPTTVTTTNPTTASIAVKSTTGVPVMSLKENTNGKQMLETLMELFNEYKTVKETTKAPVKVTLKSNVQTFRNPPEDRMLPPLMAGFNPYEVKAQMPSVREIRVNPYKQSLVQIPLSPADRALQAVPYHTQQKIYQKNEYRMPPITIQTNSVEVAPLAIPLSKPMPVINQHIIVTTPNPFERHKGGQQQRESKQRIDNKFREVLGVGNERNHRIETPTYADLTKKLHIAENIKNEFRDTYKDRIQRLKERIKYAHEQNRDKVRELSHALGSDLHLGNSRLAESSYQSGLNPNMGSGYPLNQQNSNRHDTLSASLGSNHRETINRPLDATFRDPLSGPLDLNRHVTLNQPLNSNLNAPRTSPLSSNLHENPNRPLDPNFHQSIGQQQTLNRPLNSNRPSDPNQHNSFNRPLESNHESLNRPMSQYVNLNRPEDPNQRDIITREVLSRLVGSNHHDVISRLVEPSPHDVINRPVDLNQQSRSHHSDAYERIEHERTHPRYKSPRFHEELERIESQPQNNYGNKAQQTCCDAVAARQQMPLTKIKQRGRFDDTHFRNFLKSQQKVTDMLERILAAKTKQDRQSVEIS